MAGWGKGWGVARKLRVQYSWAIYHLMNRGDRREPIFKDDADRAHFLESLGQCCTKTEWQVHAWCLMLGQMVGRAGENHYAEERQESDAQKARRIVAAELKRWNWTESEL